MLAHYEILGKIPDEKFVEIYKACSRKIRNMLEGQFLPKKKKGKKVSLKSIKNRDKNALAVRDGIVKSEDDQMAAEIVKTWLYSKRELLKDALDYFEIPNEDGITQKDLDPIEGASGETLSSLFAHLQEKGHDPLEIGLYLAFIDVQNLDDVAEFTAIFS